MFCKNCDATLKEGAKFCPNCGAAAVTALDIPQPELAVPVTVEPVEKQSIELKCANCGTSLKIGAAFCPNCGIKIEHLTQERNQSNEENRTNMDRLNKIRNGLMAAIVIGVTCIIIAISVGNQYISIKSLRSENLWLESNLLPINITSIKARNQNNSSQWITEPSETLYSSQMRYLMPEITYNSIVNEEIIFYIKIIQPNGNLSYNPNISPNGYTYKSTVRVNRGVNQTLSLGGWGNDSSSSYRTGEWTVEVWYKNVCFISEKVLIH
jgi:uncharacterized Zn finger protein (UPF0148 family)